MVFAKNTTRQRAKSYHENPHAFIAVASSGVHDERAATNPMNSDMLYLGQRTNIRVSITYAGRIACITKAMLPLAAAVKAAWMTAAGAVVRVSSERKQREILAVQVVLQIKDARETGAGYLGLGPRAIIVL